MAAMGNPVSRSEGFATLYHSGFRACFAFLRHRFIDAQDALRSQNGNASPMHLL
jgi:hypothetical protein